MVLGVRPVCPAAAVCISSVLTTRGTLQYVGINKTPPPLRPWAWTVGKHDSTSHVIACPSWDQSEISHQVVL